MCLRKSAIYNRDFQYGKRFNQLEITQISKYIINKINIPLKISNDETTECVSEITGIAIPSMFELKLKNKMSIFELLIETDFEKNVINNGNNGCLIQLNNTPKPILENGVSIISVTVFVFAKW